VIPYEMVQDSASRSIFALAKKLYNFLGNTQKAFIHAGISA